MCGTASNRSRQSSRCRDVAVNFGRTLACVGQTPRAAPRRTRAGKRGLRPGLTMPRLGVAFNPTRARGLYLRSATGESAGVAGARARARDPSRSSTPGRAVSRDGRRRMVRATARVVHARARSLGADRSGRIRGRLQRIAEDDSPSDGRSRFQSAGSPGDACYPTSSRMPARRASTDITGDGSPSGTMPAIPYRMSQTASSSMPALRRPIGIGIALHIADLKRQSTQRTRLDTKESERVSARPISASAGAPRSSCASTAGSAAASAPRGRCGSRRRVRAGTRPGRRR